VIHSTHLLSRVWCRTRPSLRLHARAAATTSPGLQGGKSRVQSATNLYSATGERPPTRIPQAARSVLTNWITYIVSGVVSFFLSPFIVRHLGDSAYGIWVLLVSLTGYLGFLDLGIRGAVTRYIARFHTEGNHLEASRTVSSAAGLFLVGGVAAVLVSAGFALFAIPHFDIPPAFFRAAQIVVLIAGANVAVSLISGVFGGVLVGLQRFDLHNSIALVSTAVRTIAIIVALRSGRGLVTLAIIQLSVTVGELLLGYLFSRKNYPELHFGMGHMYRAHVALIFSFGIFALLIQASNYLIYYTDALVIGSFLPISMNTFFAIGSNLTIYARDLVGGFSRIMTPMASKLEVEADRSKLREAAMKAARYCAMAILPVFVTFIIRGRQFIGLWMGASYVNLSGHVLWILSIPWFLGAAAAVFASVMLGISRHKPVVPVAIAEGVTNLALSIILVKKMGVIGVAWGTAIPNMAVSVFFWPWYVRRELGVPIREYARKAWLLPAVALIPFAICSYLIGRFSPPPNLFIFFVQVAIMLPIAFLGVWYVGLSHEERAIYTHNLMVPLTRVIRRT
jgi:O-antigen/teichoic acid export membrane protein